MTPDFESSEEMENKKGGPSRTRDIDRNFPIQIVCHDLNSFAQKTDEFALFVAIAAHDIWYFVIFRKHAVGKYMSTFCLCLTQVAFFGLKHSDSHDSSNINTAHEWQYPTDSPSPLSGAHGTKVQS